MRTRSARARRNSVSSRATCGHSDEATQKTTIATSTGRQEYRAISGVGKHIAARAGYIPTGAEFDDAKISRLKNLLSGFVLSPEQETDIIEKTKWAVIDLVMSRNNKINTKPVEKKKLSELATSARVLAQNWGALDETLRFSLRDWFRQLPPSKSATPALGSIERAKQFDQIDGVLGDDLWQLVSAINAVADGLRSANWIKSPAEYLCIITIGQAWLDNTGTDPTVTRNVGASGKNALKFQLYVKEAVPLPEIGSGIIRNAVEQIRFAKRRACRGIGAAPHNNRVEESPKEY